MKSHFLRLSLLGSVLSVLTLNVALAGDVSTHDYTASGVTVPLDDLNLARPSGLDRLHHRVESAARKVCGVENFKVSLDTVRKNRECVSSTINSTLGKIDGAGLNT